MGHDGETILGSPGCRLAQGSGHNICARGPDWARMEDRCLAEERTHADERYIGTCVIKGEMIV